MNKRVEYISFSKNICEQLIANGPKGIKVAYLGGDLSPRELAERGYTGLDYHIGTMRAHEEWFDEARKLGLEINVWTVNDEGSMKYLIVDYITTDEPELLQSLLGKQRSEVSAGSAGLKRVTFYVSYGMAGSVRSDPGRGAVFRPLPLRIVGHDWCVVYISDN